MINPETALDKGPVVVDNIRLLGLTKNVTILSGPGGTSCQMCTATNIDFKDKDLVVHGFPINRTITDARQLFLDIEETGYILAFSKMSLSA